jgi:hypothetical protein
VIPNQLPQPFNRILAHQFQSDTVVTGDEFDQTIVKGFIFVFLVEVAGLFDSQMHHFHLRN